MASQGTEQGYRDASLVFSFLLFVTQIITILCVLDILTSGAKDKQTKQTISSKSNFKQDTCAPEASNLFETTGLQTTNCSVMSDSLGPHGL